MKKGFPPIADNNATILILGSMPSEVSLQKNKYYAYSRNTFWKVMARLLNFPHDISYEKRTAELRKNNIALWDVIQTCIRPGSLDSDIDNTTIVVNDFSSFYRHHPEIKQVFFNGAKAEKEYLNRVLPTLMDMAIEIEYCRLPSTSPAMAQLSIDEKVLAWSIIKKSPQSS